MWECLCDEVCETNWKEEFDFEDDRPVSPGVQVYKYHFFAYRSF
eukprot:CAMPEP_0113997002 /NCGR_PEP_ID=MMETSP0328-20130328/12059_1 /TAXON_ID=39455 /ORGANISM="Alexandrium minutum" /LENGTH=43 /assembly_acc=CAM_ASM_000350